MSTARRFLIFGAHPDDPDVYTGGLAIQLASAGHQVKFVSLTDGSAGHHIQRGMELISRRYAETQAAAKLAGLTEYQVMNNRDAELENTLNNRAEITRIIRNFSPDAVITHRLCDYHADHRTTAQLVLDTSFLVQVPNYCPDTPPPAVNPVYAHCGDPFTDPRPVRPDVAVNIDPVINDKFKLLDCHTSQFYEWLPWIQRHPDFNNINKWSWMEKRRYLDEIWGARNRQAADNARDVLIELYGKAGRNCVYAEIYEQTPYGRQLPLKEFQRLFLP
ncbi:MAG: PIG-L family deacetylase [Kiritimatiellales bacterium]